MSDGPGHAAAAHQVQIAGDGTAKPAAAARPAASEKSSPAAAETTEFVPPEPKSFAEANLTVSESGIADPQIAAGTGRRQRPPNHRSTLSSPSCRWKSCCGRVEIRSGGWCIAARQPMNDYQYQLTDKGRERARRLAEHCTYFGAAPVSLAEYIASVAAQSLTKQHPTVDDLDARFRRPVDQPATCWTAWARRSIPAADCFSTAPPGNGKTQHRRTRHAGIRPIHLDPAGLGVDGEIIRLFDPSNHEEAPLESSAAACSTTARSTSAGSASAGRRSSSAAN